ncbi:MAG: AAA family ATPase [Thermoguttaceae bacterium]|nr:AAA family ATPase [Thermoguttaceae bacterium]MBP3695581.1 AAA family ATPase [Thermoguttaceae bacterium]
MFELRGKDSKTLKIVLDGAAGSGKTFTALRLAHALGSKVFVIDSERGSSRLYFGEQVDGQTWNFPSYILPTFSVDCYTEAIQQAVQHGADVIIIDGISQAWNGANGVLELVDMLGKQKSADGREKGTFQAWGAGGKAHNKLIDSILTAPCHVLCTMRTKADYVMDQDERGKMKIRRVGVKPVQRDDVEFEFDIILRMQDGIGTVTKSRCRHLATDSQWPHPGQEFADVLKKWISGGKESAAAEFEQVTQGPPVQESDAREWTSEEMRAKISELVSSGRVRREDILEWRIRHDIPADMKLTEDQTYELASAMMRKAEGGTAEDVPF